MRVTKTLTAIAWVIFSFWSPVNGQNAEIITFNAANMSLMRDAETGLNFVGFVKIQDKYLNATKIKTVFVKTYGRCSRECAGENKCVSFNFAKSPNPSGDYQCELLSTDKYNNPEQFQNSTDFNHYFIEVRK